MEISQSEGEIKRIRHVFFWLTHLGLDCMTRETLTLPDNRCAWRKMWFYLEDVTCSLKMSEAT